MKKFICSLFFYIGLLIVIFNPQPLYAETIHLPVEDLKEALQTTNPNQPLIEADNEFVKLIAVIYLIDKLYPEGKINKDITPFLHRVWPTTKIEKLEKVAPYFKFSIMIKRRFVYVKEKLKQKIHAAETLLQDAPIIAKDDEFAPKYSDQTKQTADDEYKVRYIPYKYLEYDPGEEGEAVRRRDKNYEPVNETVIDEIVLAILDFNVPALYRALKKLPAQNDGSREKLVELGPDLYSRLLTDTAVVGTNEKVNAVLQIQVPHGWYINGDFLNPQAKPHFFLSEDKNEDLNIKEYQLFYPTAYGVVNGHQTSRILAQTVTFPIQFTRRDIERDLKIKGSFTFQLCKAKTKECRQIISNNNLTIPSSIDKLSSIHDNYVTQAFAHLPGETTKHAKLKEAWYDPLSKTLTVKFDTTKTFSNVAAMAEDAASTNFYKPHYKIDKNEVTVSFKTELAETETATENEKEEIHDNETIENLPRNITTGGEVAISASFDKKEVLRTVITPKIITSVNRPLWHPDATYIKAFLFGILINLMPGVFYLLQTLLMLFIERPERRKIFFRYGLGSAIAVIVWAYHNRYNNWSNLYLNSFIMISALMLTTSYLMHSFGYMNFNLFRPLKGKIRRGFLTGLFTILIAIACPFLYKTEVLNNISQQVLPTAILQYFLIWCGVMLLPLLGLIYHNRIYELPIKMHYLNKVYILIGTILILKIIITTKGLLTLFCITPCIVLTVFLWYIYPYLLAETTKQKRSSITRERVFNIVQKHAFIAVSIIWLLSCLGMSLIKIHSQDVPSPKEHIPYIEQRITQETAYLFKIEAYWDNKISFISQKHIDNMIVESYHPIIETENISQWYQKCQKTNAPLYILFTKRHPDGLCLPDSLEKINWKEAQADFFPLPKKRKDK